MARSAGGPLVGAGSMGGMFAGMISPLDPDQVLGGLGDKCVGAIAGAVRDARVDLADMRAWRPAWFPPMSDRGLSNLIHERIWAHLCSSLDDLAGVSIVDREPERVVYVGVNYRLRIKKHDANDRIRTYPTAAALEFWSQELSTLDGLELVTLAAGYRWLAEQRQIGPPVVSCRDGLDNPLWAVTLTEPTAGIARTSWTPIDPTLPRIDGPASAPGERDGSA